MALRHAAAFAVPVALLLLASAPASAQSGSTTPPGGAPTGALLPDLTVLMAAASVKCVGGKSVTATITATVQNKGTIGAADFSRITWQIGLAATWGPVPGPVQLVSPPHTVNPQLGIPQPIKPGEARTFSLVIAGIPAFQPGAQKPWQYAFAVIADPKKGIVESNETNNEKVTWAMDPCPK